MPAPARHSFWSQTAPPAPATARPAGPVSCDVAIVGGGFTGLACALLLAERGADVVLFEAGTFGAGASGASGGQVNPMLAAPDPAALAAALPRAVFDRLTETALHSADDLFALIARHGIACEARQKGWLRVDHSRAAARAAHRNARAWNAHGARFEVIGGADLARLTGCATWDSGVLCPQGGAVQPLALVHGLMAAAQRAGARLTERAPVTDLRRQSGQWRMRAAGAEVTARQVVLATNGHTGALWPGLAASILPMVPIQIACDPLPPDRLAQILPEGHTISDTRRLIMYARREPGGQVVFGGIGWRLGRPAGFGWLLRDAPRLFPALARARWRWRWGGTIALTEDRLPHLHEPAPGLLAGLGYSGRGVALSVAMGRALARRALGADPETLGFPITPIRPFARRGLARLGMAPAALAMRLADRLEGG